MLEMMLRTCLAAAMVFAGKAFGHDTWSTFAADNRTEYMIQGTGLSAEDEFNQRDDIDFNATLLPGSCTRASNRDLLRMHNDYYWRRYCENSMHCSHVDHWHANDGVNMYGRQTCIREDTHHISWSPVRTHTARQSIVRQSVVNHRTTPLEFHAHLTKSTTEGITGSISRTASFEQSMSFQLGVPDVMSVGGETTLGFSSSSTREESSTHEQSHTAQAVVDVAPGGATCVKMECSHTTGSATWSVPFCLSGNIRCDFGSHGQCNGHYYWLPSVGQCSTITGTAESTHTADCSIAAYDGECTGPLGEGIQLADRVIGVSDEVSAQALGLHVPAAACVAAASAVFLLTLGVRARLRRDAGRLEERLLV